MFLFDACTDLPDSTDDADDDVRAFWEVKAETVAGTTTRSTADAARSKVTAGCALRRCNLVFGIVWSLFLAAWR